MLRLPIAALVAWMTAFVPGHADVPKRLALVIGNSQYEHTQPLANPENDAKLMASTLRRQGFDVLEHTNLGFKAMKRAIRAYTTKLEASGKETVGLIFYAGHGVQVNGRNYLLPTDAQISKEGDVEIESISTQGLLSGVQIAGNRLNIIILDACRNNPYRGVFRSVSRGFARMDAPVGSLVAFSTAPGMVAADGTGANSPYTAALASAMAEPGLKIEDVFKRVRATVYAETAGQQVPWESSSIFGDFYFAGRDTNAAQPGEAERAWRNVKDSNRPADLKAFMKRYPNSFFVDLARSRLEEIQVAIGMHPKKPELSPGQKFVPGQEFEDCDQCPTMVVLPRGGFTRGSPDTEPSRQDDEGPQRRVTIAKPIAVGKFEVTYNQFLTFVSDSGHTPKNRCKAYEATGWKDRVGRNYKAPGFEQAGSQPVVCVSWNDATAFAAWLSRKTGKTYRLLSEAEWEYAARAGTTTPFSFGQTIHSTQANFDGRTPYNGGRKGRFRAKTTKVGSFAGNAFGLHDMHGNVWEWVEDCWVDDYADTASEGSPYKKGSCTHRVLRGGAFGNWPSALRSANRDSNFPTERYYSVGFRVARTLE